MTGHHQPRLQHLAIRVALIACVGGSLAQLVAAGSDDPAIARVRSSDASLAALIDRATAHFPDISAIAEVR